MIPSFSISEASFDEHGNVVLTFEGLKVINIAHVRLIESLPRLLKAARAAYFYINSSEQELKNLGKKREDYLSEFQMCCPDLRVIK